MNSFWKDILDTCKNNPLYISVPVASKLNKNFRTVLRKNVLFAFILTIFCSYHSTATKPYGINTVVIDAGHGGHDPGCLGKRSKEKDVTLGISLKLGKYIEEHFPDVKVLYTRKKDEFVELYER